MTNYLQLFKHREQQWFEKLRPFLFDGSANVLKIGNGFGYLTEMIRPFSNSLQVFEIAIYEDTINKESVTLYDGKNLLLDNKSVDVAIFNLSLHHIPKNIEYLKNVINITKKRVILVEETYDNIFQKIHLIWRDWYVNKKADQPCEVFWNSYLKRNKVERIFSEIGLKIIHRETNKHHSYYKELIVLDIV
jgi:SAM-dependent methyltransferase